MCLVFVLFFGGVALGLIAARALSIAAVSGVIFPGVMHRFLIAMGSRNKTVLPNTVSRMCRL